MNDEPMTRLKVSYGSSILALRISALTNLVLLAAMGFLTYSLYTMRAQVHEWKPLVIRVSDAGKADPVDLIVDNNPASELEAKVFAAGWITDTQSFDPNNANSDIGRALACTDAACAKQLVNYYQTNTEFQKLRTSRALVQCHTNSVQTIRTDPWEIRVDYTLSNFATNETRTWYALLTLKATSRSFSNPYGLLVTGVRINTTLQ